MLVKAREILRVDDERRRGNGYMVRRTSYDYELLDQEGTRLLAYHWHPGGRSHAIVPHLHPGLAWDGRLTISSQPHLPTGDVAIVEFVEMLIREFGVPTLVRNWEQRLSGAGDYFRREEE
jgi:hypothetical protein